MAEERLTRQELSWLLAQEARGAAKALRRGVTDRERPVPNLAAGLAVPEVQGTLDALDGAIQAFSELQTAPQSRARRGRVDLAALLLELVPKARIVIEPGAGTEVFGDEADLRRMLYVWVCQTSPEASSQEVNPEILIRREGDLVKLSVALGPDRSATAELERRWLGLMANRWGGQLSLESGVQMLALPADGASAQHEVETLRRELEEAQQQGEAYARELAFALTAGEALSTSCPPAPQESEESAEARLSALVSMASALAKNLRALLHGLQAEVHLAPWTGPDSVPPSSKFPTRLVPGAELLSELSRIGDCDWSAEPAETDVARLVQEVLGDTESRAARHAVDLRLAACPTGHVRVKASCMRLLLRCLLDHGISATPRGRAVVLRLRSKGDRLAVTVTDGGPAVPVPARADLLRHRLDPAAVGRPPGIALLVADALASYLGSRLLLRESAQGEFEVTAHLPVR